MTKDELKKKVSQAIRARRADVEALGDAIFAEPELGFKEVKTSAKVKKAMDDLGIEYTDGWGLTGIKARLKGRNSRRTVALIGELDAIVCRGHAAADPVSGAAHCCGHNVQIGNLMAVAMAFKDAGIMDELDGDLVLFAVPAEEYVEIDYRNRLREEGKLRYLGGKGQIISEGGFDDIDMALQMHVTPTDKPQGEFNLGASCNGFIGKLIEYRGKAAHAAMAPETGVNALNAAVLGINAVNALRERFADNECVRFHPIINAGGDLVNVVPDYVKMESYVRAATLPALKRYNDDIDRAMKAGADALGAECAIHNLPGYLPLRPDEKFREVLGANAAEIFGADNIKADGHSAGSTDMGDVSHLMPVVHPWVGCVTGVLHGDNYCLSDRDTAYVKTPEVLAHTIIDLLCDNAQKADEICRDFKPVLNRETYCEFMDEIVR